MAKTDIRILTKEIIAHLNENDKAVIRVEDLINKIHSEVDLTDVSMDEMEKAIIIQQVYPLLAELDWASVVRGHGYYINMQMCTNPDYFQKVIQNSHMDISTKRLALKKRESFRKMQCEIPGQMILNLNTMEPEEEKTTEEILEMLAKEA